MTTKDIQEFIDYVFDFYGKEGVYDMGATKEQITFATCCVLSKYGSEEFLGDTTDRERVCQVMIDTYNLVFP